MTAAERPPWYRPRCWNPAVLLKNRHSPCTNINHNMEYRTAGFS
jgi:hypothetical protein